MAATSRASILVAAVTLLTFAGLFRCDFTYWDDDQTVALNPRLTPPTIANLIYYWTAVGDQAPMQLYVPVTYTVWSAVAAVAQRPADIDGIALRPWPFHGLNVLIHVATTLLVYRLLLRLFDRPWLAAIGSLLFAVHPVQVETVAWISGTKDLLGGFFAVAALLCHLRSIDCPGKGWSAIGMALFTLGMLSKPTAIVTPLLAGAIDALILKRPIKPILRSLWPWFVLMAPCLIWTRASQPSSGTTPVPFLLRPGIAADAVAFYLVKLAWPAHLCVDYGRRPSVVLAGPIRYTWILAAAVAVWAARRAKPFVLFLIPLLPVLGLVPFEFQYLSTVADHYMYLPMLGVAITVTALLRARQPQSRHSAVVWGLIVLVLATRSALRLPTWKTSRTLLEHTLAVNPNSFVAADHLGSLASLPARHILAGRSTLAPSDPQYSAYTTALETSLAWYRRALAIEGGYTPALNNASFVAAKLGRNRERRDLLIRLAELQPALQPAARENPLQLGPELIDADAPAAAIRYLDFALGDHPGDSRLLLLRSTAVNKLR